MEDFKDKTVEEILRLKYGDNTPRVMEIIEDLYTNQGLTGEAFAKSFYKKLADEDISTVKADERLMFIPLVIFL
ncbi:MAG: hypothetical protein ACFE9R_06395 [Candidatus Hermodarchaeota archaeon]